MKKLIFGMTMLLGSATVFATTPPAEINDKVLKAFEETFKNPTNVNWHEYEDFSEVNFKQGDIRTEVRYDNEGNILGTTRYYFEKDLPPYILSKIRKRYPDRSVFGVTEIYTQSDLTYYLTMEDEKNWYTVKANSLGSLEQTDKFKKAPTH
jgi:hypothetical protein